MATRCWAAGPLSAPSCHADPLCS